MAHNRQSFYKAGLTPKTSTSALSLFLNKQVRDSRCTALMLGHAVNPHHCHSAKGIKVAFRLQPVTCDLSLQACADPCCNMWQYAVPVAITCHAPCLLHWSTCFSIKAPVDLHSLRTRKANTRKAWQWSKNLLGRSDLASPQAAATYKAATHHILDTKLTA